MDWAAIGEATKAIAAVATAAAAWFAATSAYKGLEKWRSETLGKRKAELAAAALASMYQMEEIFRSAREPFVLVHEMGKKPGIPDEIAEDANFAPEFRLFEHNEFFSRFRAQKHEFAAIFGREAAKPFDEMWRVRIDINHAVHSMLTSKDLRRSNNPDDKQLWNEFYRTAFRHHDEKQDAIIKRIRTQIEVMESVCRPAIDAKKVT